jgi:MFS family permease
LGIGFSVVGLFASIFLVKDTIQHVQKESTSNNMVRLKNIFWETTWKNRNLGSISQAGLINNLNDAMVWGILPILLLSRNFSLEEAGLIVSVYPMVWGLGQLLTGRLADIFPKKTLLFLGMFLQSIALVFFIWANAMAEFIILCIVLGIGTALVYPTFLAGIADFTHPDQRAESIGVFRLWRDLGYAFGAILTGIIADYFGSTESIGVIATLTFASAIVILVRMKKV